MSENFLTVLEEARRLPVNERRELAARIMEELSETPANEARRQAALAIVEETFGSIKGLDRDTLIQLPRTRSSVDMASKMASV